MNRSIILAAGQGKRMKTDLPKVMCEVLGIPMLRWVITACEQSGLDDICVVTGFEHEQIESYLSGKYPTVFQSQRLGTGHAVMQAEEFLKQDPDGNVLILCGDAPFIDKETITEALKLHTDENNSVTVITAVLENPAGYGRIIRSENGIAGNVEQKDCTAEQLKIREVNSGAYWFKVRDLLEVLFEIKPDNAQAEYYLPDCIGLLIEKGKRADAFISENNSVVLGANDRKGLLALNDIARKTVIEKHLENGVEFICTDGIIIEPSVEIECGAAVLPGTILKGSTKISKGAVIGPNSLISDTFVGENTVLNSVQAYQSKIGSGCKIGPFVHIRPNSEILDGVHLGNFVEIKNSVVGKGSSVSHLTYVGDSDVGKNVNFGCGVVTVNYDGTKKSRTVIKDNAFIGCNTNLVAPVTIGEAAYTAAGSTITKNVPDGALAIERSTQVNRENYAKRKLGRHIKKGENIK